MMLLHNDVAEDRTQALMERLFTWGEIENIRLIASDLFRNYCDHYSGRELSKKWAVRKKMSRNSFWRGLGWKAGSGKFFQLFDIEPLPKDYYGTKVYQIGYFDVKIADSVKFKSACDSIPDRRLLPGNKKSFDGYSGEPTKYFCAFITDLMIEAAMRLGY